MEPVICPMLPQDITAVLGLVRELAVYERLEHDLVATEADYQTAFFGDQPAAEAIVAEIDSELVGYAMFFSTFSSFKGRAGIWLEDIYVQPAHRSCGIGKSLLKEIASIAENRHAGRYEWCVLDWNKTAIDFYEKAGGTILDEWRIVRLEEGEIASLSKS